MTDANKQTKMVLTIIRNISSLNILTMNFICITNFNCVMQDRFAARYLKLTSFSFSVNVYGDTFKGSNSAIFIFAFD